MKRTALKRKAKAQRTAEGDARRREAKAQRAAGAEAQRYRSTARRLFRMAAYSQGCVMCKHEPVYAWEKVTYAHELANLEAHHIIPKADLKTHVTGGVDDVTVTCDPRNALGLCMLHHARHENWLQRVPRTLLPAIVKDFADDYDLQWLLDREYAT